jgi:hypothetical protein
VGALRRALTARSSCDIGGRTLETELSGNPIDRTLTNRRDPLKKLYCHRFRNRRGSGFWGKSGTNGWSYDIMLIVMNLVTVTTGGGNLVLTRLFK